MSFAQLNLHPSIIKAVQSCGYTKLTPIQEQSIPSILSGEDLVASAQTGTGKTAAFMLPALQRLSEQASGRKPRVLVLTPTRELASQITKAAGNYGKFLKFNMANLVGGMPYRQQVRDLSKNIDLVVATPGRLLDHMESQRLDLSQIEMLILDEADRMLDMGFIDDVRAIANATPENRQTLLFSATVDNRLMGVIKQLLNSPRRIDLSNEKMTPVSIEQKVYLVDSPDHKARLFRHLLDNETMYKAIIFSATKIGADKLAGQLIDHGYAAAALHGDLKQSMRNRTVEALRKGKIQYLVATDVAARGIDIADMTHVINYDLPKFCEDYVHRIGRTGRAGKKGVAISFALPADGRHVVRIERFLGTKLKLATIAGLEPKQSQINPNASKPSKGKKRKSNNGGRGSQSGFKVRGNDKSSNSREDSGFKPRGKGKSFGSRDESGFKPRAKGKSFGSRDDAGFKPRRYENSSSSRDDSGFKPRGKGKSFGSRDDAGFKPRRDEKSSGSREDSGFKKRRDEKSFGSRDDSGFKKRRDEKSFGSRDDSGFKKDRKEKSFGSRANAEFKARGKGKSSGSYDKPAFKSGKPKAKKGLKIKK
jgi:superfamily II DNA/RNA helicase